MRITIEIDESLLKDAMQASGNKTRHAAVKAGLRLLVQESRIRAQEGVRRLRGRIAWQGVVDVDPLNGDSEHR